MELWIHKAQSSLPPCLSANQEALALRQSRLDRLPEQINPELSALWQGQNWPEGLGYQNLDGVIQIGPEQACPELKPLLQALGPWKKGPFNILGHAIDAEWQSQLKWQRLKPFLGDLRGAKIADIGCHNGYFMFHMALENPDYVMGIEPFAKHWFTFQLLNHFAGQDNLFLELFGVEEMDLFPKQFDLVFCMGILYHHTDPMGLLRKIKSSMTKGGRLVVDCQGIPGDESVALVPGPRYAGAKGIWFLPTVSCLKMWLKRAGFQGIQVVYQGKLEPEEQRRTPWADINSLKEFLDPHDPSLTIEGYPAPHRFYLIAT